MLDVAPRKEEVNEVVGEVIVRPIAEVGSWGG